MRDDRDDRRDSGDRRDSARDPEQLDERVEELEARVRDLRDELGRPPEGPLGLPRPPTPREVLSFTGEYAIPTAIAVLEANVRALKALEQVIRVMDPDRSVVGEERDRLERRATDASRLTLDRLESALEDVETTIRESDLPREDEARSILDDARRINREIRDRVESERREVEESRERERDIDRQRREDGERRDDRQRRGTDADLGSATTIEITDESEENESDEGDRTESVDRDPDEGDRAEVDVEAELESIKNEIERRERDAELDGDEATGDGKSDAGESDAAGSDPDGDDTGDTTDSGATESDGIESDSTTPDSTTPDTAEDDAGDRDDE